MIQNETNTIFSKQRTQIINRILQNAHRPQKAINRGEMNKQSKILTTTVLLTVVTI